MGESLSWLARWLLDVFWQDGGQRRARRNAWRAMLADRDRARARAEAAAALGEAALGTSSDARRELAVR